MKKLCLILLLFVFAFTNAQHNHGTEEHLNEDPIIKHYPPHGGEIVDAGKYKLEILIDATLAADKFIVYVLRKNYKVITLKNASADITVNYKGGGTDVVKLTLNSNRFQTDSINLLKPSNILFRINLGKKQVASAYYFEGLLKK